MKKLLLILTLFVCCGCSNNNTEQRGEKVVDISNSNKFNRFELVRIGNHQYIFYHAGNQAGICHYEDCDYCHGQH